MKDDVSDLTLIRQFLHGDAEAFDTLYFRYRKQLYSYLNKLLPGQHALVDDIFQQAWIKVIRNLPDYKDSQKFLAWIMRIAHNLTIDYFRKNKREVVFEQNGNEKIFSSDTSQPWMELDKSELADALEQCIEKLPGEQKEVFILRQDALGFKEIAQIQRTSINTALGRMQYALRNLRKCLMREWR